MFRNASGANAIAGHNHTLAPRGAALSHHGTLDGRRVVATTEDGRHRPSQGVQPAQRTNREQRPSVPSRTVQQVQLDVAPSDADSRLRSGDRIPPSPLGYNWQYAYSSLQARHRQSAEQRDWHTADALAAAIHAIDTKVLAEHRFHDSLPSDPLAIDTVTAHGGLCRLFDQVNNDSPGSGKVLAIARALGEIENLTHRHYFQLATDRAASAAPPRTATSPGVSAGLPYGQQLAGWLGNEAWRASARLEQAQIENNPAQANAAKAEVEYFQNLLGALASGADPWATSRGIIRYAMVASHETHIEILEAAHRRLLLAMGIPTWQPREASIVAGNPAGATPSYWNRTIGSASSSHSPPDHIAHGHCRSVMDTGPLLPVSDWIDRYHGLSRRFEPCQHQHDRHGARLFTAATKTIDNKVMEAYRFYMPAAKQLEGIGTEDAFCALTQHFNETLTPANVGGMGHGLGQCLRHIHSFTRRKLAELAPFSNHLTAQGSSGTSPNPGVSR